MKPLFLPEVRVLDGKQTPGDYGLRRRHAQVRSGCLHGRELAAGETGHELADIVKHLSLRLRGVLRGGIGSLRIFKDANQIVGAVGDVSLQLGVAGETEEWSEQRGRVRGGGIGCAGWKLAEAEVVEIGGMGHQVAELALIQRKSIDKTKRLGKQ